MEKKEVIDIGYLPQKETTKESSNTNIILAVVIILIILVVAFVIGFFFYKISDEKKAAQNLTANNLSQQGNFSNEMNQSSEQNSSEKSFNTEEIHWNNMPLIYKINNKSECEGTPIKNLEKSFSMLEESTGGVVSFLENNSESADIEVDCINGVEFLKKINTSINCKDESFDFDKSIIDPLREGYIKEGDYLINTTLVSRNITENSTEVIYRICYVPSNIPGVENLNEKLPEIIDTTITKGFVRVYVADKDWSTCANFPAREIHQILHSFGFAHSQEAYYDFYYGWAPKDLHYIQDIMFSTLSCKYQKRVDTKYISCLKKIYSNDEIEGDCSEVNFIK